MNKRFAFIIPALAAVLLLTALTEPQWGFFGHRRINKLAVFTLPPEMMVFFKKHIEYLSEHAVDPDKRRYATKYEAIRHYIDIDHWGVYPFDNVPRGWLDCLVKFTEPFLIDEAGDTLGFPVNKIFWPEASPEERPLSWMGELSSRQMDSLKRSYKNLFYQELLPQYYEDDWILPAGSLRVLEEWIELPDFKEVVFRDRFSPYGILPYHLISMQKQLTRAFGQGDPVRLLRLLADFGHYVGDAHVPLHTTENYNGQFTDQIGIHAFWESRIPELFADREFDFFVGKAAYIDQPEEYIWEIVLSSHALLDSVLLIEKELSLSYPTDQQYCYDERLERTIRTQCKAYAAEYNRRMGGMVERRMSASVLALGSLWYTAWVDAGQPDLGRLLEDEKVVVNEEDQKELDRQFREGKQIGRTHGQ